MQPSENEIIKKMLNIVAIAQEIHYFHTIINGLAFHVDKT